MNSTLQLPGVACRAEFIRPTIIIFSDQFNRVNLFRTVEGFEFNVIKPNTVLRYKRIDFADPTCLSLIRIKEEL